MPLDAFATIATMTKVATQRAAGICGDDVAVNTKLLLGLPPGREIPATLKVMRGSLLRKAALIPIALGLSAFAPWAILPLLAVGGIHLASEGAHNLLGKGHGHGGHGHGDHEHHEHTPEDPKSVEKKKIGNALTVDLILSAEITVLTLSLVAGAAMMTQLAVLAGTGLAMTAGMYGLIGGLINMGPLGKWLEKREGKGPVAKAARGLGKVMGKSVPHIMKAISAIGTVALFVIGGELLLHGIPGGEHLVTGAIATLSANPLVQSAIGLVASTAVGLAAGFAAMPLMDKIEPKIEKAVAYVQKLAQKVFSHKQTAPKKDAPKPAAAPKPQAPPAAPPAPAPLDKAPDAKAALNDAAKKPVNDNPAPPPVAPAAPPPKIANP